MTANKIDYSNNMSSGQKDAIFPQGIVYFDQKDASYKVKIIKNYEYHDIKGWGPRLADIKLVCLWVSVWSILLFIV